jgi:hypothetical protein
MSNLREILRMLTLHFDGVLKRRSSKPTHCISNRTGIQRLPLLGRFLTKKEDLT